MCSPVKATPAAPALIATAHFAARLQFETDCSDVAASFAAGTVDFVLLDVRGPEAFASGHVPGAVNLPHREISLERMQAWPTDTLFVAYCAGPHCNGVHKADYKLASLGFSVKEMIGGVIGWQDEGLSLTGVSSLACACE